MSKNKGERQLGSGENRGGNAKTETLFDGYVLKRHVIRIGDSIAKALSQALTTAKVATPSNANEFAAKVKSTRLKLMAQLSPILDGLKNSESITYDSDIPDLLDSLDQVSRETIEREVLFRSLGSIGGPDGAKLIQAVKITVTSVGAEYGHVKSARVKFMLIIKNREPYISGENIIGLSSSSDPSS